MGAFAPSIHVVSYSCGYTLALGFSPASGLRGVAYRFLAASILSDELIDNWGRTNIPTASRHLLLIDNVTAY